MNYNNLINRIKQINPNIKFVGEFDDNNQKTGYWEEYYWSNGNLIAKGSYLNDLKDGYWEFYYCGDLWYKANYKNGNEIK